MLRRWTIGTAQFYRRMGARESDLDDKACLRLCTTGSTDVLSTYAVPAPWFQPGSLCNNAHIMGMVRYRAASFAPDAQLVRARTPAAQLS